MIFRTVVFLGFFLTASLVVASETGITNIQIYKEQRDNHRVSGLSLYMIDSSSSAFQSHVGISANKITSDRPLERSDRYTIFPVYIFGTISLNTKITPYLEFGLDTGDLLFDKSHEGQADETDIYIAAGLKTNFNKAVNFHIYAKSYHMRFTEIDDPLINETTLYTSGIGISINF